VGTAKLQVSEGVTLADMAEMMVYKSADGTLWVRPLSEFNDGRFEPVDDGVQRCPRCGKHATAYNVMLCGYWKDKNTCPMRKVHDDALKEAERLAREAQTKEPKGGPWDVSIKG
jgi:hypothetical protein